MSNCILHATDLSCSFLNCFRVFVFVFLVVALFLATKVQKSSKFRGIMENSFAEKTHNDVFEHKKEEKTRRKKRMCFYTHTNRIARVPANSLPFYPRRNPSFTAYSLIRVQWRVRKLVLLYERRRKKKAFVRNNKYKKKNKKKKQRRKYCQVPYTHLITVSLSVLRFVS